MLNPPWTIKSLLVCAVIFVPLAIGFTGRVAVLVWGQRVRGVVEDHGRHLTRRGHLVRTIYYHYVVNGKSVRDDQNVTLRTFGVRDGATVAVRRIRFAGMELDSVTESVWDYLDTLLIVTFFFLLSATWLWISVHDVFVETPRRRGLVTHGFAVMGTLTEKRPKTGKGEWNHVVYSYRDGATPLTRVAAVTATFFEAHEVGHQVVLLHRAGDPHGALPYEDSGYRVGGETN